MLATRTLAPSEPALADDQHSLMRSAFAHLAPGVLIAVFYLAMMFIAIPVELGDLLRRRWRRNDRLSLEGVVPGWLPRRWPGISLSRGRF